MEKIEKENTLNGAEASTTEDLGNDEKTVYELGFHIIPSLSEDEVSKEFAEIKAFIEKFGGEIISEGSPKAMQLAYIMAKKQEGKNAKFDSSFFGWVKFEAGPENAISLKEDMDLRKSILRFIIIKTVREDTSIGHRPIIKRTEEESTQIQKKPEIKTEKEPSKPISEAELDKTIEELVA